MPNEIWTLLLGVLGGVLGAFFKFWIEDLRSWEKDRLRGDEEFLLAVMLFTGVPAGFRTSHDRFPRLDAPWEPRLKFEDKGAVEKLLRLNLIQKVVGDNTYNQYSLTPGGRDRAEQLKHFDPSNIPSKYTATS